MSIGEIIKFLRKEKGFSQQKLSDISGIPLRTIQEYEKGSFSPRKDKIEKLATAFNVPELCFEYSDYLPKAQNMMMLVFSELTISERLIVLRVWNGYTIETAAEILNAILDYDQSPSEYIRYWEMLEEGCCSISWEVACGLSNMFQCNVAMFGWSEHDPVDKYEPFGSECVEDKYNREVMNDKSIDTSLSANEFLIIDNYRKLNSVGRSKLFDYAQDLALIEKYTAPDLDEE